GGINGEEGNLRDIVVDTGRQFPAVFVATVPVDVDGAFAARLIGINFLTPPVVHAEFNLIHEARALQPAFLGNASAGSAFFTPSFHGAVVICAEDVVALVAIGRKKIRKLVIGTVVDTNRVAEFTFITRAVYCSHPVASCIRRKVLIFKKQVAYASGMKHEISAHGI